MDDLLVETSYGKLQGLRSRDIEDNEFFSFKGIPYAKPPVGDLRFEVSFNDNNAYLILLSIIKMKKIE